jgi:DNA-binding Lrp family transcriptional regulator
MSYHVAAYLLINADVGHESEVQREIQAVEFVKRVDAVYGVYDLVAYLEAPNQEKLTEAISRIRKLNHIHSTLTMFVVENK